MTRAHRWLMVALGLALLIATPLGLRALPVADSDISAPDLLAKINGSKDAGYSGYVESLGTLQLPVTDRFTDVGALLGERTRLRVWWRSSDHWRVDKLVTAGEVGSYHSGRRTITWDYERADLILSRDPDIRLPRASDALPPELAYRLLAGAGDSEVERIPATKIAGITAPGLRLTAIGDQSSIDHVDIWADESSGLPLKVEVVAIGDDQPSLMSAFTQFSSDRPAADDVAAPDPPDTVLEYEDVIDIADAANQFAPISPPQILAGLQQTASTEFRGVGVYGTGLSRLIAIPLWDDAARPLRDQLGVTPNSEHLDQGDLLAVGPLTLLLTENSSGSGWLLAGTVTSDTLVEAAREIASSRWSRVD